MNNLKCTVTASAGNFVKDGDDWKWEEIPDITISAPESYKEIPFNQLVSFPNKIGGFDISEDDDYEFMGQWGGYKDSDGAYHAFCYPESPNKTIRKLGINIVTLTLYQKDIVRMYVRFYTEADVYIDQYEVIVPRSGDTMTIPFYFYFKSKDPEIKVGDLAYHVVEKGGSDMGLAYKRGEGSLIYVK